LSRFGKTTHVSELKGKLRSAIQPILLNECPQSAGSATDLTLSLSTVIYAPEDEMVLKVIVMTDYPAPIAEKLKECICDTIEEDMRMRSRLWNWWRGEDRQKVEIREILILAKFSYRKPFRRASADEE
jgi:hypothetical protein